MWEVKVSPTYLLPEIVYPVIRGQKEKQGSADIEVPSTASEAGGESQLNICEVWSDRKW